MGSGLNHTVVLGDWDDIDAAVIVAARETEMAVERQAAGRDENRWTRFYLRTSTDEPVELTMTRLERGPRGLENIEARAKVGRFENAKREAQLIEAVRRRVKDLAGVEHAPVR